MNYHKMEPADIDALKALLDDGTLLIGDEIGEDYWHDELGGVENAPEAVIRVKGQEEISRIMRYAYEKAIPVTVRGSGTGLVGGAVALYGGILLDTSGMNRILELDEDNLTVTVEPGVLLMDLTQFVESHDLFYPPDPGEKSATIGGNISTNAGGMRAVKYGTTRDYVRGLTVVLPNGDIIEVGGKTVKNSTGYSLKDLIIGSEGTLCIITKAVLKLLPLPGQTVSLLIPYEDIRSAIETVPKIIKSKAIPTAIEFMERETILFSEDYLGKKFPDTSAPAYLLLTFDGHTANQLEEEYRAVAKLCLESGARDVFLVDTQERKDSVWGARGAFLEAIKASTTQMDECDVVVPRSRVADFVLFTHETAEKYSLRMPGFGHAGDGNLHIYLCRDDIPEEKWHPLCAEVFDVLYHKAEEFSGLVSGEHGIGYAKKGYMKDLFGETQIALMRRIKAAFDEKNILNPGKICE